MQRGGGTLWYADTLGACSDAIAEVAIFLEKRKEYIISSRIFVGNLPFDATQGEIEELFSQIGEIVEVFLPIDRLSGRPRGFAFVEFTDNSSAATAIEKLNETELKGRNLRVTEAEERTQRPRWLEEGPPRGGERRGDRAKPKGSRRRLRAKKRSL